jgi:hypothetical protein
MVARYGEKVIILRVMELRLDLAYHCKIGILEYSGELLVTNEEDLAEMRYKMNYASTLCTVNN